jgi:peptidyl-prolyl cis-trans isomerase C
LPEFKTMSGARGGRRLPLRFFSGYGIRMPIIQHVVKLLGAAAITVCLGAAAVKAQEVLTIGDATLSGADKVIAKVNGHEIKASEVAMASDDIVGQLPDLPANLRYPFVVEYLIERHLLAQVAVKDGIAETDEYKRRLALYQAKALRDAYFFQKIRPQVTDEEIKRHYDEEAAKIPQVERIRARHILVPTEKQAKDVLARLKKGEKFEDIAKQVSTDGSKEYGGDLGYFSEQDMVPEFSKAAFALKVGETSQPVKTDYGWHIIKLEDRKMQGAQPLEAVKTAIRNLLLRQKVQEAVIGLRKTADIQLIDPDLQKYAQDAEKKRQQIDQQRKQQQKPDSGDAGVSSDGKSDPLTPQP